MRTTRLGRGAGLAVPAAVGLAAMLGAGAMGQSVEQLPGPANQEWPHSPFFSIAPFTYTVRSSEDGLSAVVQMSTRLLGLPEPYIANVQWRGGVGTSAMVYGDRVDFSPDGLRFLVTTTGTRTAPSVMTWSSPNRDVTTRPGGLMSESGRVVFALRSVPVSATATLPALFRFRMDDRGVVTPEQWSAPLDGREITSFRVSSDGSVVVANVRRRLTSGELQTRVVRWTEPMAARGLGTLPGTLENQSVSYTAVSPGGNWVAGVTSTSAVAIQPFVWSVAGGMRPIPAEVGTPIGVTDAGLVLGKPHDASAPEGGTLWDEEAGFRSLVAWLMEQGVEFPLEWASVDVQSVAGTGRVFFGIASVPSGNITLQRPFRVELP